MERARLACGVAAKIAHTVEIPRLAEALAARGMDLVPFGKGVAAEAALFGADATGVPRIRAQGWRGPLMLVLPAGASVARALDAGADDAVSHRASADEIAARLAARLRRNGMIEVGALRIDPIERRVTRAGKPLALLPREYELLLHLARHAGQTIGRAELLAIVWGLSFDPGTNVVDVHVSRLRAKLDRDFSAPMLHTDRGRGYRLARA